jgi:hypothetical protein
MIRFMPDDWLDVVMRPLDMVSPEANTYVEIAAPDVRLAGAMLLALALLVLWKRRSATNRATVWLLALLLVSMAMWLATSGNGRYFIAWLVLLGPLCAGLIRMLPGSVSSKFAIGGGLIAMQLFVLAQASPFGNWTWAQWAEAPYFQIDPPPARPATYVSIANISYSLVAPQFPPGSRWIGLAGGVMKRDEPMVRQLLATSPDLTLFAPALPSQTLPDGRPTEAASEALGRLLQPHGLALRSGAQCSFLASRGFWSVLFHAKTPSAKDAERKYGFWLCPLDFRPGPVVQAPHVDAQVDAAFQAVQRLCPRFFSGAEVPLKIDGGWVKHYDSDTKVYVLDDGSVFYKFWRSVNGVRIGTRDEVLSGRATIDCTKIRAPNWRRGGP